MDSFLKKSSILYGETRSIISAQFENSILLVDPALKEYFNNLPNQKVISLPKSGEALKTLSLIEEVTKILLSLGADRRTTLIGIGGGATTDFVGFLGSIFMRGIKTVLVPTTLLAQVDASIGGKNGVDIGEIKNILGTVQEPACTIIDTNFLETVPDAEIISGLAEVIKIGLLTDKDFVEWLSKNHSKILSKDKQILSELVRRAVDLKLSVVANDAYEQGARRLLNLGHTIGHAVEKGLSLRHGEAVSIGIVLEAKVGNSLGLVPEKVTEEISSMLSLFRLPIKLDSPIEPFIDLISSDKKREGDTLFLPLITNMGNSEVFQVSFKEFISAVRNIK